MARQDSSFFMVKLPGESKLLHITKQNIRKLTMLRGDPIGLMGTYDFKYYGDCSNIYGRVRGLVGDISKLRGDVSNVSGYCTGCELDCTNLSGDVQNLYRIKIEEERFKKGGLFLNKHKFLTNEDNERLWDVWLKIANSTIGMTNEEYALIDKPIKNKPPFPVDVWGRHYVADQNGEIVCFSINPVDILLLRTNQEIQTCWSIYDKHNRNVRMRLLLARACINPTVGVCFRIKFVDKFNIFNGLPFKYYKHTQGTFFQYNSEKLYPFGDERLDVSKWFKRGEGSIAPYVVGHDGQQTLGHGDQKFLTFYEKYIKRDFALWKEKNYTLPDNCEHVLSNFEGCIFLDKDLNVIWADQFANDFVAKQVQCLKERMETGVFDEKV